MISHFRIGYHIMIWAVVACMGFESAAERALPVSYEPIIRFISVRPQKHSVSVNVRSGPGTHYPLEWQLTRARWPLGLIRIFQDWYYIRDHDGIAGWVHKSMLSHKQTFAVLESTPLYAHVHQKQTILATMPSMTILKKISCKNDGWCRVETFDKRKGWITQAKIWGANGSA